MLDPITLASSTLTSFSHANNLIKAIIDARDNLNNLEQWNALQSEIATIQTGYIALTQQNLSLLTEVNDLKKELARIEAWNTEKDRYELKDVGDCHAGCGVFVYTLKESAAQRAEPTHWLCANCYNQGKKSILQLRNFTTNSSRIHNCPLCKTEIIAWPPHQA